MDSKTGLLKITSKQYNALKPLNFKVGSNTYTLTANAQIWPRSLNTQIGGNANSIYLIVADLGKTSLHIGFINGYAFLYVLRAQLHLILVLMAGNLASAFILYMTPRISVLVSHPLQ